MSVISVPISTDPNAPPEPSRCKRCGAHWPWQWHVMPVRPRQPDSFLSGPRWAAPKLDPCASCAQDADYERKAVLDRRVEDAGFPYVPYVLHQRLLIAQRPEQDDEGFMLNVRRHNEAAARPDSDKRLMLGVLEVNAKLFHTALRWAQQRTERSLFLHGPPGTGKTLLMSALGRLMLQADPTRRRFYLLADGRKGDPVPEHGWDPSRRTALVLQKPRDVVYKRLDVLMSEQRDRFKGRAQPVRNMGRYPGVLCFDELGISANPTDWERDTVNHILGERFDRGLPTVMSCNLNPQGFQGVYGPRVGSRLRSCIILEMRGPDWRG